MRVGLTLLAIWLAAQSILLLVTDLTYIHLSSEKLSEEWLASLAFHGGSSFTSLLIGIGIFSFRGRLSERLCPPVSSGPSIGTSEIETFAVALLGLYVGISAITSLVKIETEAAFDTVLGRPPLDSDTWPRRITDLVQLAIGLALALRAPGLVALWHRLRTAGHDRISSRTTPRADENA